MAPAILCAEGDRQVFEAHESALSKQGYRVIGAHDGEQALAQIIEETPALMLVDVLLPKCDGFEVLEQARTLNPELSEVPVIMLSATRISPADRARAESIGATDILSKPIPVDGLVQRVNELIAPSAFRGARKPHKNSTMHLDDEGDLRAVDFAHLLHLVRESGVSGVLMLENARKKKALQIHHGTPISVKSNLVDECLGSLLVRQGIIDETQARTSFERARGVGGLQGEILVAMDLLDEEALANALRAQAIEKLYEIFTWKRGRYQLRPGKRIKRGNALALDYSVANLILAGARDYVPARRVERFFSLYAGLPLQRAENEFDRFQDVSLADVEEEVVLQIGDGRCIDDYTDAPEALRRAVYGLVTTGLVDVDGEPAKLSRAAMMDGDSSGSEAIRDVAPTAPPGRTVQADLGGVEISQWLEQARGKSYYEVLDVTSTASDERIREAYEVLARRFHGDLFRNASASVKVISEQAAALVSKAYAAIATAEDRVEYAKLLKHGLKESKERAKSQKVLAAQAAFQRGEAALKSRDYEDALVAYGQAVELYSRDGEYHAHYGWALHLCHPDDSDMAQEAIEHVRRGAKLARDREKPYLFLGRLYKVVGRPGAAEKMFTRAVQIRPGCVEAMRELRLIQARRSKGKGLIGRLLNR